MLRSFRDDLLNQILSQPTAPFREGHVIDVLKSALQESRVPHFQDPAGNIIVGAASRKDYLALAHVRTTEPLRIYIAHMDHPGFIGEKWLAGDRLSVKWLGGSPTAHLTDAPVWLASRSGDALKGKMVQSTLHASGKMIATAEIQIETPAGAKNPKATDLYGGFGFRAPVWREGDHIYTKAADDLVGCFSIVSLAMDLQSKKSKKPFLGLLTRGEEVGFIGAIAHFNLGWLNKARSPVMAVSLETSRALPGAEIGKGPVVRLGDRYTVFDPGYLRVFTELAEKALPGAHQRRIMDGGSCEATAATVFGVPAVGISVPLGNYHNQSFEGGPDSRGPLGPAPEFVHLGDVKGLITLCHALLEPKLPWTKPWDKRKKDFAKSVRTYSKYLKSGP